MVVVAVVGGLELVVFGRVLFVVVVRWVLFVVVVVGVFVGRGGQVIFFPPRSPGEGDAFGTRWASWRDDGAQERTEEQEHDGLGVEQENGDLQRLGLRWVDPPARLHA